MEDNIFDKVHERDLKKTMEKFYIDYAMSVIASRALPDVRDGLKPVQRRVLYSMIELNNGPDKPHRKCARIVGDTMGKYHPHGDSSIYGALVNMAQEWSTRLPADNGWPIPGPYLPADNGWTIPGKYGPGMVHPLSAGRRPWKLRFRGRRRRSSHAIH